MFENPFNGTFMCSSSACSTYEMMWKMNIIKKYGTAFCLHIPYFIIKYLAIKLLVWLFCQLTATVKTTHRFVKFGVELNPKYLPKIL
jgi:hypothetical protein